METKKCDCGKASMTYEGIGEDQWSGEPVNTLMNLQKGGIICICKDCKQAYDSFDLFMVKLPVSLVQVIKCKCGAAFAGGVLPDSMIDDQWQKELAEYLKKGCISDIIPSSNFKFESCSCGFMKEKEEGTATSTSSNQLALALELRDDGMERAELHANNVNLNWTEKAYKMLEEYVRMSKDNFLAEDFRAFATKCGLEEPPSKRAFGGIIGKASKRKLIEWCGYRKVKNPKAHLTPANLWKRA